jgi:hypothetical protein
MTPMAGRPFVKGSVRVNHIMSPGPAQRVVIGRLVMPVAATEQMLKDLGTFLERTRQLNAAEKAF